VIQDTACPYRSKTEPDSYRTHTIRLRWRLFVLFQPYKAGDISALWTLISVWMRLAIMDAMGGPEGNKHLCS
jgi:hypothetical protein